jgi:hypothetical protein
MHALRTLLARHRAMAVLVLALVLAVKALVPSGWMIQTGERVLTVAICADASGGAQMREIAIPTKPGHGESPGADHQASGTCAFSVLGMDALGGADALLLALALSFILALGFAATPIPAPRRARHVRPPLRGPPAIA